MDSSENEVKATSKLACQTCGDKFSRADHLMRHVSSAHSAIRPFACAICRKSFTRKDVYSRHLRIHSPNARRALHRTIIGRTRRACLNCANAKVHCDESELCEYCRVRGLRCSRMVSGRDESLERSHPRLIGPESNDHEISSRKIKSAISAPGSLTAKILHRSIPQDGSVIALNVPLSHPSEAPNLLPLGVNNSKTRSDAVIGQDLPPISPLLTYGNPSPIPSQACFTSPSGGAFSADQTNAASQLGLQRDGEAYFPDLQLAWDFNISDWMPFDFSIPAFDDNQLMHSCDLNSSADQGLQNRLISMVPNERTPTVPGPVESAVEFLTQNHNRNTAFMPGPSQCTQPHIGSYTAFQEAESKEDYAQLLQVRTAKFPDLQTADIEALRLEISHEVQDLSESAYNILKQQSAIAVDARQARGPINLQAFPCRSAFNTFIQ
ncbi:hypothetical protein EJ08DRAFT_272449 [Tothia fuscella]|uniref:C2H2-type domain-containing protein n=1 Tax=Tothia fuscella TaxID=1048955 RepID=A0A9P4NR01_9PEZI|nr:hypothetical protein EJ08DRAFT_272449 [Tothia fuscella]